MVLPAYGLRCDLNLSSLLFASPDIIATMFERREVGHKLVQVAAAECRRLTSSEAFTYSSSLLISLWLMFIPDKQERLLSGWLAAANWPVDSQRKVSPACSAGHARGQGV